jgi:hypothetical protein
MSKKKISFSQQRSDPSQQVPGSANSPLLSGMLNSRLELAKIKVTPTDSELGELIVQTEEKVRI